MKMNWIRLSLAVFLSALLSCTTAPPKKKPQAPAPTTARQEFNKAQIDYAAGADKKSASAIRRYR